MHSDKKTIFLVIFLLLTAISGSGCTEPEKSPAVGDYAKGYLQNKKYTRLIIEIDFIEGFEPTPMVLDTLRERIDSYCDDKQVLVFKDAVPKTANSYSIEDIKLIEKEHRDFHKSSSDITAYVLYLNGAYVEDSNVLGVAYSPSGAAIFKEKIDDIFIPEWAKLFIDSSDYEESVLVHEFGHLLALVNLGYKSASDHEGSNTHHCKYDDCVMYHAIESASILDLVTQEEPKPPSDFGQHCRDDLAKLKSGKY